MHAQRRDQEDCHLLFTLTSHVRHFDLRAS